MSYYFFKSICCQQTSIATIREESRLWSHLKEGWPFWKLNTHPLSPRLNDHSPVIKSFSVVVMDHVSFSQAGVLTNNSLQGEQISQVAWNYNKLGWESIIRIWDETHIIALAGCAIVHIGLSFLTQFSKYTFLSRMHCTSEAKSCGMSHHDSARRCSIISIRQPRGGGGSVSGTHHCRSLSSLHARKRRLARLD